MAWFPEAIRKEIAKHKKPLTLFNRVNLHVAVSEADSLFGYFSRSDVGVVSHFYVRRDGTVEQYVDTRYQAAADLDGNDASISVETEGGVHNAQGEPWSAAQLASLAKIFAWAVEVHGIPARLAENSLPGAPSRGLSWHRLGVDPWRVSGGMRYSKSRGKICPGDAKISQIPGILAAATTGQVVSPLPPAPSPSPAPTPEPVRNYLIHGDRGARVTELQQLLKSVGYGIAADGIYGNATREAVTAYQVSRGLVVDGVAGPDTLGALRSGRPAKVTAPAATILQIGSTGDRVRAVQNALKTNYPAYAKKLVVDGVYGKATAAAVREFQRRSGIGVDGVAGPVTLGKLGV